MKTNYTMSQIRNCVSALKEEALKKYYTELHEDFLKFMQKPEIAFDISKWKNLCKEVNVLYTKYNTSKYRTVALYEDSLKGYVETTYRERNKEKKEKIEQQFKTIYKRITPMRNPDKALEFLKLCGIELPESTKEEIVIPVDVEFIKSVLPQNKMLPASV